MYWLDITLVTSYWIIINIFTYNVAKADYLISLKEVWNDWKYEYNFCIAGLIRLILLNIFKLLVIPITFASIAYGVAYLISYAFGSGIAHINAVCIGLVFGIIAITDKPPLPKFIGGTILGFSLVVVTTIILKMYNIVL